jgi:hypothetical protein
MNYIHHLNQTFRRMWSDEKLTPFHVSLYFNLFQYWNMAKFKNPISINREEMMRASKIGSINTYIKCMKELDFLGYVSYKPSFNHHIGSKVYLFIFDNASDNSRDKGNDNASDNSDNKGTNKVTSNGTDNGDEQLMRRSINNTVNNTKHINNTIESEREKKIALAQKKIIEKKLSKENLQLSETNTEERKKVAPKKESENGVAKPITKLPVAPLETPVMQHPQAIEVKNYFIQNAWPILEAEKFFSHYQSNGWLVGGKSPMINWQASAQKWILNSKDFTNNQKVTSSGVEKRNQNRLHVSPNKNYAEPL